MYIVSNECLERKYMESSGILLKPSFIHQMHLMQLAKDHIIQWHDSLEVQLTSFQESTATNRLLVYFFSDTARSGTETMR